LVVGAVEVDLPITEERTNNGKRFLETAHTMVERKPEGVILGPDVTGRNFRVSGPRAVLDLVKKYNGNLVEVIGLVKKSELARSGPGSGSRVTMTAPATDPTRTSAGTTPTGGLPVMDVTSVRYLSDVCPIR